MASIESGAPESPKRARVDFDDAELDRYLEENRGPGGETIVDIEGWENLPKDQLDRFIQRLRDRAQNASTAVQSRPVDLDQVNAQLLGLSGENTSSTPNGRQPSRHERASTEPLPGIEFYQEQERVLHKELVNAGGRPVYPINLINDVSENPDKYRDMISFWAPGDHDWMIFEKQLGRWRKFRTWQQDHRGVDDEEGEFAADVEWRKTLLAKMGETDLFPLDSEEKLEREFKWFKQRRDWRRGMIREERIDVGFRGYVQAVKKRLARHGFTRALKLDRDPTRQDELTTWIEYLNYEYWWYDEFIADVKRLQSRYDKAWKELVDSNVLRPFETEEYILNSESAFRRASERAAAQKAVESAKSAAMLAWTTSEKARKNPQHPNVPIQERMRMLAAAHSGLDKANKSLESIKARNDRIGVFYERVRNYRVVKEKVNAHNILLRWILEQITLIEAELNESKVAGDISVDTRGRKRRFRHDQDDATTEDQNSSLWRGNDGLRNSLVDNTTSNAQTKSRPKRNRREEPSSKQSKIRGPCLSLRRTATSGHTAATSIGGTRGSSGTLATSNWGGGEKPPLNIMEGPGVKISNDINRLLRSIDASQASEIPPKKRRRRVEACHPSDRITSPRSKEASPNVTLPSVAPKPRRSARIADREERLRAAVEAQSNAIKTSRQSIPEAAQVPTPPSSAEPQDRIAMSPATRKAKNSRLKRTGGYATSKPQGILKKSRSRA